MPKRHSARCSWFIDDTGEAQGGFDESALTGEAILVDKSPADALAPEIPLASRTHCVFRALRWLVSRLP